MQENVYVLTQKNKRDRMLYPYYMECTFSDGQLWKGIYTT